MYEDITDKARHRQPDNNSNVTMYTNNPKGNGKKKQDGNKSNSNSNSNSSDSSERVKKHCNYCNGNGHLEEDFFKKYPEKKAVYDARRGEHIKAQSEEKEKKKAKETSTSSSGTSAVVGSFSIYTAMVSSAFRGLWLVDTGAAYHMVYNKSLFDSYHEPDSEELLLLDDAGNGGKV
jgi:DNA mismatch repair ATPase MutL